MPRQGERKNSSNKVSPGRYPGLRLYVSPRDWGLPVASPDQAGKMRRLGLDPVDLENRARQNTFNWLLRQWNDETGAFYGYYDAPGGRWAEPQTANIIAPWQLIAAYDRYGEPSFLERAGRASDWLDANMVDTHPMSFVLGGVRDNLKPNQLWTKYTADYVVLNLELYDRTHDAKYLGRATQGAKFLLQSQHHNFAPKYDAHREQWLDQGWQSFGRVVVAMLALYHTTKEKHWLEWGTAWATFGLSLQHEDGSFYLINRAYYNSDVAADELRALVRVYGLTGRRDFLDAAERFGRWHLEHQRCDGAWLLSLDRFGVPVNDYVGPGDVPNIAIAMMLLHRVTGRAEYFASAVRALHYSLGRQCLPGADSPYAEDENAQWGFWSWDPPYDYTLSSDQSTHHVRAYWIFNDYFASLSPEAQEELVEAAQAAGVKPLPNQATTA